MNTYKIVVAYDGTDYEGWQVQPHQRTIANVLQNSFFDVFGHEIKIIGASRTDAGVHALGQVARFSTDISITPQALHQAWLNKLTPSISIRSLQLINESFHPQAHVQEKIYWYHFFTQRPLPFLQRYGYYIRYQPDLVKLQDALAVCVGTHDFRSFCTMDDDGEDTIRTITNIRLHYIRTFNVYRIEVVGPRFLRYMIRRIVGACLEVASRKQMPVDYVQEILIAKNPAHALPTAPAKGLLLYKIKYMK